MERMALKFKQGSLSEVIIIEPDIFKDNRGVFMETYHYGKYSDAGIEQVFVQDNHSHSKKNVLRGLHYQLRNPQGKLVYVIKGKIFDVAIDIRRGSPTFGKWSGALLSDENRCQLFIPKGFAHGLCVLSETADVIYKNTDLYAPGDKYGILWSDPSINIAWPIKNPILSEKDSTNPKLSEIPKEHLPVYKK
jgi:dTDP-4-dehydrorhamnose 3,5-epimerase